MPYASAASVREVLDRLGVLGTFSVDCTRPVSPSNYYVHFRPLGGDRVEIELMVGPQQRQYAYVIDRAAALGGGGLSVSMANPKQRLNIVYAVDGSRLRTMESVREGGQVIVTRGVLMTSNQPTPWLNKCDPRPEA
jgi:hypothetical protein